MRILMIAAAAAICLSVPMMTSAKADKVVIRSGMGHHRDFDRPRHKVVIVKHRRDHDRGRGRRVVIHER